MDEMANSVDEPIAPKVCPRCGKEIKFYSCSQNSWYECPDCGELYYDNWLGIWRIQRHNVEED